MGKYANKSVVLKFGITAAIFALLGAYLLSFVSKLPPLFSHHFHSFSFDISLIRVIVGCMVILAALFELIPAFSQITVPSKYLPLGGILSGFFGGLTGNQGALRAAFLIKVGMTKEQYIATSALCNIIVDVARLTIYAFAIFLPQLCRLEEIKWLLIAASLTAFLGSYIGSRFIRKITLRGLHIFVGILLLFLGVIIMLGIKFHD